MTHRWLLALLCAAGHWSAQIVNAYANLHSNARTAAQTRLYAAADKKYVVITGGVISGIGKGITASSMGVLCKMMDRRVTAIKIDPYLNVDAGTMSPFEHGETFVLDDGGETDLDLGNYERFLDIRLTNDSNLTTGKVYKEVIEKERRGQYLGKTVQIIPHITNEIIEKIERVAQSPVQDLSGDGGREGEEPEICVIELGGTIGDIESMPFVEALRQLQLKVKRENFCLVHVSMVPIIGEGGEQKTKPTQHSVKELRGLGLAPDFIVCRSKQTVDQSNRDKIALFTNLPSQHVLSIPDVPNIYHVPLVMMQQGLHEMLAARLGLGAATGAATGAAAGAEGETTRRIHGNAFYQQWRDMALGIDDSSNAQATVALVGKYCNQQDAYLSVISALRHACIGTGQRLNLVMVESSHLEEGGEHGPEAHKAAWAAVRGADAVLVPGGFGIRGIEGKVAAARYARENRVPFLGVCLGMQAAVIEYTRAKLLRPRANSREFAPDCSEEDAAVIFMPEGDREVFGGTMRLGARRTTLAPGSLAAALYGDAPSVLERHRHRYEVNPSLVSLLEAQGLRFSGKDDSLQRMEVVELPRDVHPYYVGTQYHPEFKSRPLRPAPVFLGLLQAAREARKARQEALAAFRTSNLQQA